MNPNPQPPAGINLGDIYHTLFRHKWLIIVLSVLGILVSGVIYFVMPVTFVSEAKILIRYVQESKALNPNNVNDGRMLSPDSRGDNIINSEIEILTSQDLAEKVAEAVGPEKVIGKTGPQVNKIAAGIMIVRNLQAATPKKSSVISIEYRHKTPEIAQQVLQKQVEAYLQRHIEIHRSVGIYDNFLQRETDQLRSQLQETENQLQRIRTTNGIISIEESRKTFVQEISRIRQELLIAEAELAEYRAVYQEMQKLSSIPSTSTNNTNSVTTNLVSVPNTGTSTNIAAQAPTVGDSDVASRINAHRDLCTRITSLEKKESDLLAQFTEETAQVQSVRMQLADARKRKETMEKETPSLVLNRPTTPMPDGSKGVSSQADPNRVAVLEAKVKILTEQLQKVRKEAMGIEDIHSTFSQLLRKKEVQETNYRYYEASLEQTRIDEKLGPGNVSNISIVQNASPPLIDSKKRKKMAGMALAGGILGGLALAFLWELFIDQSIKRPVEVEAKLRLPLFLWIPDVSSNGKGKLRIQGKIRQNLSFIRRRLLGLVKRKAASSQPTGVDQKTEPAIPDNKDNNTAVGSWDPQHPLRLYYEALCDRLMAYFKSENMTHKPKLVAVTGCSTGSGVSSIATGLAGLLSETGDGNVLLVDMNMKQGAAHAFFRGKPNCALADAFELEKREGALVQENLYVVSGNGHNGEDSLPKFLPKLFNGLVPQMKASDYDYIVFDMPPVSQTSITTRLAGHMDITLLVVEAEKDQAETIRLAAAMLQKNNTGIGAVLNKRHRYVPQMLNNEL